MNDHIKTLESATELGSALPKDIKDAIRWALPTLRQSAPVATAEREDVARALEHWMRPEEFAIGIELNVLLQKATNLLRLLPADSTSEETDTILRYREALRLLWAKADGPEREALEWAAFLAGSRANWRAVIEQNQIRIFVGAREKETTVQAVENAMRSLSDAEACISEVRTLLAAWPNETTPEAVKRTFTTEALAVGIAAEHEMSSMRQIVGAQPGEPTISATLRFVKTQATSLRIAEARAREELAVCRMATDDLAKAREIIEAPPEEPLLTALLRFKRDRSERAQPSATTKSDARAVQGEISAWHEEALEESHRTDRRPDFLERQAEKASTLGACLGLFRMTAEKE